MKTLLSAVAFAALSLAGVAHADGLPYPPEAAQTSTLTRAQVVQELAQARAAGQLSPGEQTQFTDAGPSTVTRAQVRAELRQARAAGQVSFGELG